MFLTTLHQPRWRRGDGGDTWSQEPWPAPFLEHPQRHSIESKLYCKFKVRNRESQIVSVTCWRKAAGGKTMELQTFNFMLTVNYFSQEFMERQRDQRPQNRAWVGDQVCSVRASQTIHSRPGQPPDVNFRAIRRRRLCRLHLADSDLPIRSIKDATGASEDRAVRWNVRRGQEDLRGRRTSELLSRLHPQCSR